MINLLPPDTKTAIKYGRYNAWLVSYLKIVIASIVLLAVIFGGTLYYVHSQINVVTAQIATKNAQIASYASLEQQARVAASRLDAIGAISSQKTHFSTLLNDLAAVTPQGVSIQSLVLTGDETQPVIISFNSNSYQNAVDFRDALVLSPLIAAADLQSVAQGQNGSYTGSVSIAFKPGALQ